MDLDPNPLPHLGTPVVVWFILSLAEHITLEQWDSVLWFCPTVQGQVPNLISFILLYNQVPYVPEGLDSIIFTADGDMRQALNNLQATFSVFRLLIKKMCSRLILYLSFSACLKRVRLVVTLMVPGVRSTTSLTCQEHGEKHAWWKVWWGLLCTEATLWFGILSYWHYHYSLPCCEELWHGWISEAGNAEGNFITL